MRVAIVNDMPLSVALLRRIVEAIPGYSIAWTAVDGAEAVRKAITDLPNAILMDLIMPVMDGATATREIMARKPCPILIVTASVKTNHSKVYEALGAGGLDAIRTPTLQGDTIVGADSLVQRLAKIAASRTNGLGNRKPTGLSDLGSFPTLGADRTIRTPPLVVIGASTGGPAALANVLLGLAPCAATVPIVIVQHIGAAFADGLVEWLTAQTQLPIFPAVVGEPIQAGRVYVAVSEDHLVLTASRKFQYTPDPANYPYRPSVDVFFHTARLNWPARGVAVLLTGMGSDGAQGLLGMRKAGWHTIAQDQETSIVYGMPKAAMELGAAKEILPLPLIGAAIARAIRTMLSAS